MKQNITAWTDPHLPQGDAVVPFVSIDRADISGVVVTARDAAGVMVEVEIPQAAWFKMAREMFERRGLLSVP